MKNILLLLGALLSFHFVFSQNEYILTDVNYIDVISGKEITNTSIHIKDGKIADINKKIKAPKLIPRISVKDKWLIPGLVDSHIHLFQSGGLYTRPDAIDLTQYVPYEEERRWLRENAGNLLQRYLACGITTVVDVGGPMYNFKIRDQFEDSKSHPSVFITGPLVSTYQPLAFQIDDAPIIKVETAEDARKMVREQLPHKPDFIKIWYIVRTNQTAESTYDIIKATVEEAHKNGLPVAVHATQQNTAKLALKAGADILVHSVDNLEIDDEFIEMLKKNDAAYIPTLVVYNNYTKTFADQHKFTPEDFAIAHPKTLGSLLDNRHLKDETLEQYKAFAPRMAEREKVQDSIMMLNLDKLNNSGARIVTGTDAGNIGTLHGSSFYDEVAKMKLAGMSNGDILKASTIAPATMLGQDKVNGSIAKGKIADIAILRENPLKNSDALKSITHVIKSGNLIQVDTLLPPTPEQLVQQQLNAYNAYDLEAFLAPYSQDLEIYSGWDQLQSKGLDKARPTYERMFANPNGLHCELVNRIVMGNTVIDHEKITVDVPGAKPFEALAIYTIENGKIAKVNFIYP